MWQASVTPGGANVYVRRGGGVVSGAGAAGY
jgi:hypothetical protein